MTRKKRSGAKPRKQVCDVFKSRRNEGTFNSLIKTHLLDGEEKFQRYFRLTRETSFCLTKAWEIMSEEASGWDECGVVHGDGGRERLVFIVVNIRQSCVMWDYWLLVPYFHFRDYFENARFCLGDKIWSEFSHRRASLPLFWKISQCHLHF